MKKFLTKTLALVAMLMLSVSSWAALLPVDASQTKITGDQLFVYFTNEGGFSYGSTQMNQYSCTNVNRIADKAGAYLYIILNNADASQERAYELSWANDTDSKCAIITFAAGETTNPTITECGAPATRDYKITAYVPDGNDAPYIHFWGDGFNPGTWPQMTATGYANTYEYTVTEAPASGIQVLFSHSNKQTADQALITDDACYNVYWSGETYTAVPTTCHDFANVKITINAASQPSLHYWGMPSTTTYDAPIAMPELTGYPEGWYEYTIENVDVVAGVNYLIRMESDGKTMDQNVKADVVKNAIYHSDWGDHKVELTDATYPQPVVPTIDWSTVPFVATAALPTWDNKFKVQTGVANLNIVNIQQPGFANKPGVYVEAQNIGAITAVDGLEDGEYAVQGAGICMYCNSFAKQVTEITLTCALGSITFLVYYVDGTFASNYCESNDYTLGTSGRGFCSPKFSWITDANGNVVITIMAGEGEEDRTYFRGNGMKASGFKLNGSTSDFTTKFDAAVSGALVPDDKKVNPSHTGHYTYTLTLKDGQTKPTSSDIISFSEQIECCSSIHGDDWETYTFAGYTYGGICQAAEDTQAPTDLSASVKKENATSVVLTLSANDDQSNRIIYTISWGESSSVMAYGNNGESVDYTVSGLSLNSDYDFSIVASDKAGNTTATPVIVSAHTTAGATEITYFAKGTDTYEGEKFDCYYSIKRNVDETLTIDMVKTGSILKSSFNPQWNDGSYHGMTKNGTIYTYTTTDSYVEGARYSGFCYFGGPRFDFNYTIGTIPAANTAYTREGLTVGNFGTLALPFDAEVEGATLYEVTAVGDESITLSPVEGNIAEAGKGYVFKATETTLTATYTAVAALASSNYMVSNYTDATVEVEGADDEYIYILNANELHKVNTGVTVNVGEHRAYFNLPDLSAAPARIALVTDESQVVTGVANMAEEVNANKMIVNGKVVILKNGVQYNALGQIIK